MHAVGFEIAIETNGTKPLPNNIDWICVSPKSTTEVIIQKGNELKLVYPQTDAMPEKFNALQFDHFYLQPMDDLIDKPRQTNNTQDAIAYCLRHPQWQLRLQTHKIIGID